MTKEWIILDWKECLILDLVKSNQVGNRLDFKGLKSQNLDCELYHIHIKTSK